MGATIREKVKGSGEWWVFIAHNGQRKSKKMGSKKDAQAVAAAVNREITLGAWNMAEKSREVLFKDYCKKWLEGYVKTDLATGTYRNYRCMLKNHILPTLGNRHLQSISRGDIRDLIQEKKLQSDIGAATVNRIAQVLTGIFSHAEEYEEIDKHPCKNVGRLINGKGKKAREDSTEVDPMSAEELAEYLEVCKVEKPDYYPFFLTLGRTGMRLGEVIGLKVGDLDFEEGLINVQRATDDRHEIGLPKSGRTRQVEMTPQLKAVLQEVVLKADPKVEWLFSNKAGQPQWGNNIRERVHLAISEKVSFRFHKVKSFRDTYATLRLNAGHDIFDVSKQLGHASIDMTFKRYAKWVPKKDKRQVDQLDDLGKAPDLHPDAPGKSKAGQVVNISDVLR